jgi:pectin methylesterase-like acyl-CoA thioesterase
MPEFSSSRRAIRRLGTLTMLAAGLGLLGPAATGSATLTVCPSGCQYTTIKAAFAVAHNGDRISIGAGTYAGGFTVRASVSLIGAGRGATTIKGGAARSSRSIAVWSC